MLAHPDRDSIEVTDDLVTVTKEHKDVGKADVAGIEIRVVADSPVPVAFRVVEQFPDDVSMDDLAVHPQFSPEKWTISEPERRMVFEDVVEPGEEVVTLYGVLEAKYDSLDPFLGEPTIDVSQQVDPGTSSDGGEPLFRGAAVAEAPTGSADGAIDLDRVLEYAAAAEASADGEPADGVQSAPADPAGADETDADETDVDSMGVDVADVDSMDVDAADVEAEQPSDDGHDGGSTSTPEPAAVRASFEPTDASPSEPAEAPSSGPAAAPSSEPAAAPSSESDGASPSRRDEAPSIDIPSADDSFLFRDDGSDASDGDEADEPPAAPSTEGSPKLAAGPVELGNSSVVSAFVEELEGGSVGDEKLAALKDALDLEPAESMRLRVSHLQSEVASLSAYADEFERFVDEEGSFTGALDEFRDDVRHIEDSVEELSADVRGAAEERTALQESLDRLAREIDALRETHESSVGRLDSRVDAVADESVGGDEIAAVRDELRAERAWRRKVVSSLEALAEDAADRDLEF